MLNKKGIYSGTDLFRYTSSSDTLIWNAIEKIDLKYPISDEEIESLLDDEEAFKLTIEESGSFGK